MAKILIVDDSSLSRRISRRILTEAAHEVFEAQDGISAIEQYFLVNPDLVLLDITMKGMNGFEVLEKLRELDPHARVVIATADIQSSTQTLTKAAGSKGFVTKPLQADEVVKVVNAALQGES
ncbi:MAG TPA: response regulator [Planctomycetaceae bacterium]|jgi:two-component system chemotaxis response regulator CheY